MKEVHTIYHFQKLAETTRRGDCPERHTPTSPSQPQSDAFRQRMQQMVTKLPQEKGSTSIRPSTSSRLLTLSNHLSDDISKSDASKAFRLFVSAPEMSAGAFQLPAWLPCLTVSAPEVHAGAFQVPACRARQRRLQQLQTFFKLKTYLPELNIFVKNCAT